MPDNAVRPEHTWSDWRIVEGAKKADATMEADAAVETPVTKKIVIIQGWVTDAEGNIVLTDKPLAVASRKPELNNPDCNY
jgi:hypothetical protein